MASTYEPIATTTLGSSASNITFNSISGSYTDLRLVVVPVSGGPTDEMSIKFNNDTAGNYAIIRLYGDGTSASSGRNLNQTSMILDAGATNISTTPSLRTIDIFSYAGSTYKSVLTTTSHTGAVMCIVGLWRSTSAINTVTFTSASTTFAAGTTATLYGIKAA